MPGMVFYVLSHVSWQQPYKVVTIVMPILHSRERTPKITLFIVGSAVVWIQDLPAAKPVFLIHTLFRTPSLSALQWHPQAVWIMSSAPI